jgi:SAM-dependent methyltransferase
MTVDLRDEFRKRGPWQTKFVIDGQVLGGNYDAAQDMRIEWFHQHFPDAQAILELGSLEGGHTFRLAQHPRIQRVVSVEGRPANLKRARFVQQVLGIENVQFVQANLETFSLATLGRFDAVICLGLLYHLPEPWKLIEQVASVSDGLFLWTHYASERKARDIRRHYPGMLYHEWGFFIEARSGLSPAPFWPTRTALLQMLRDYGFERLEIVQDEPEHVHGPAITLAAYHP